MSPENRGWKPEKGEEEKVQVKVVDRRSRTLREAAGDGVPKEGADDRGGSSGISIEELPPSGLAAGAGTPTGGQERSASAGEARRLPSYVEELQARLEQAERRTQEVIAAHRQAQTEQEEFRKRLSRDVQRRADVEVVEALQGLLEVLDDLNRALRHAEEAASGEPSPVFQALLEGVRLVRDRFLAVLRDRGVESTDITGLPFDPQTAEAVRTVEVTDPARDGMVVEEDHPGYFYKGQLLRPARVAVGRLIKPSPRA